MKKSNFQLNLARFAQFTWAIALFLLVLPVLSNAQSGKTNFSGNWTFNEGKSNLGDTGGRRFGGGDMVVKQEANLLTVERTRTNRDGENVKMTSKYTLDGKESTNTFGQGESKSTAKWSADGKSLTIVTKMSFNGNDMTSTEVWSLTDAKTISIASTRPNRDGGEVKTTRVYDKK
ncbi:MAG: hypothetical protein EP310_09515 [Bacteroidetes bacterium]|nr:MAG: hypothetical protein EP310_09515 [Bacteroidota bacterium]